MKVIIFAVSAVSGGGLTTLNECYDEAIQSTDQWHFIVSESKLRKVSNVEIICYPWARKSLLHLLIFDKVYAPSLIRKMKPDKVISMRYHYDCNDTIEQVFYETNALFFSNVRFKIFESYDLWIRQRLLSKKEYDAIRKADKVIVENKWMMDACVDKLGVGKDKFIIKHHKTGIEPASITKYREQTNDATVSFFYPASAYIYKNHKVIVEALLLMPKEQLENIKVTFTLKGDENRQITHLYKTCIKHELPISWIGSIDRNNVFDYYGSSILLFPSYLEAGALPLVEASIHDTPIISSDLPFAHDALENYEKVDYFPYANAKILCDIMQRYVANLS